MRYAQRGLAAAHLGEGLCFGAAAGLGIAVAGVQSGAERGLELCALGVALALVAAWTWVLGSRTEEARVARRLDDTLRFRGALVTAWESERQGSQGRLVDLLDDRVRSRLRRDEALRVVVPSLAPPLIALLLAAALWLVGGRAPESEPPVDVSVLLEGARLRVSAARGAALEELEAGEIPPEEIQAWKEALAQMEQLSVDSGPEALEGLEAALAERMPEASKHPALERELAMARAQLDTARAELERRSGAKDPEGRGELASAGQEATNGGQNGARDGRMSGSLHREVNGTDGPDVSLPDASPTATTGIEEAAWAAWWPDEYDGLVQRWVDRSH